ncbi:MAG: flagellar hook protein FlgE [Pseudomonadota bacterium]|jgi:flagellar hook protein FlgE
MTVFGALTTAVTGLGAQSRALGHISDNIANSQTVGYKRVETAFQTLVTQSNSNLHSPGGVRARPLYTNSVQGTITQTQTSTNLAISGAGFFQVSRGEVVGGDVNFQEQTFFTRAGDFQLDRNGYLRNSSGYYLNGWGLAAGSNQVDRNNVRPIRLAQLIDNPSPTANINLSANLPLTPAESATLPTTTVPIIDLNGSARNVELTWRKQGNNLWRVQVNSPDSTTQGTAGTLPGQPQAFGSAIQLVPNTTPVQQLSQVSLASVTQNETYTVTIAGQNFSHRATSFDTVDSVIGSLLNKVNASGRFTDYTFTTTAGGVMDITGPTNGRDYTMAVSTTDPAAPLTTTTSQPATRGVQQQVFVPLTGSVGDINDVFTIPFGGGNQSISYTTDGTEASLDTVATRLAALVNANADSPYIATAQGPGLTLTRKTFDDPVDAEFGMGTMVTTDGRTPAHVEVRFGDGGVMQSLLATNVGDGNATVAPTQNAGDPAFIEFDLDFGNGSQRVRLNLGTFQNANNGLTQYAGSNVDVFNLNQDGFTRGAFRDLAILGSGEVVANYDNGRSRVLAQIPLFQVGNPEALQKVDGNAYVNTVESGNVRASSAGESGSGNFVTSSVEGSNVDLADEFTKLIITQRAYSGNTRVVTAANEMLQEALGMAR